MTASRLSPTLLRVVAPNPSPLTGPGTNTYVLGRRAACVVDPGPDDPRHLAAVLAALDGRAVSHVVVTHGHADHAALAPRLAAATGAPVLAFGSEGGAAPARPDVPLRDGDVVAGDGWRLAVLHTPGHAGDHVCLDWEGEGALLSGDHAMGWATTLVAPPDGDMGAYVASLARLADLGPRRLLPGHGEPVADGRARLLELLAHRRAREAQVLAALAAGPATPADLAAAIYAGLDPPLRLAAELSVTAHLLDLHRRGAVAANGPPATATRFRLA